MSLNSTSNQKPLTEVGFSKPLWWVMFSLATFSMSWFLQTFKAFSLLPTLTSGLWALAAFTAMGLFLAALIYDGYAKEKVKGAILRPFGLFDRLYARQYGAVVVSSEGEGGHE